MRRGYVIPATRREDSGGIDFWVKMPRDSQIFPVQVTQRGVRMYRKFHKPSAAQLEEFCARATDRIEKSANFVKNTALLLFWFVIIPAVRSIGR